MKVTIQTATLLDLNRIKALCQLIGFVHFHHRRDQQTTLYHLAVQESGRRHGVGRMLVCTLRDDARQHGKAFIRLKCPEPLSANQFYERVGFVKTGIEPGKLRALCVWEMTTESA